VVCIFHINNVRSRCHGAAESRCHMCHDGLAQGGGTVWHHGSVNGWSDEGLSYVYHPGDGLVESGGGHLRRMHIRRFLCSVPGSRHRGDRGTRPRV
jgi:hypothetical protein